MTLTETKALRLVSNEEAVRQIPELAPLYEEFMAIKRAAEKKNSGCSRCKVADPEFYPVRNKVIRFILGLSSDAKSRIKKHLVTKTLQVLVVTDGIRKTVDL